MNDSGDIVAARAIIVQGYGVLRDKLRDLNLSRAVIDCKILLVTAALAGRSCSFAKFSDVYEYDEVVTRLLAEGIRAKARNNSMAGSAGYDLEYVTDGQR